MRAPLLAADAVLYALHGGPASLMQLCWAMHWIYDNQRPGTRDVAVSTIETSLRTLTRAGLVARSEVVGADFVGGQHRTRRYGVWALTRPGMDRVLEIIHELGAEHAAKVQAEAVRWWSEDWPTLRKAPSPVDGWVVVMEGCMACLAHEARCERTSSWNVSTFPPGVPEFIVGQAQRSNARAVAS